MSELELQVIVDKQRSVISTLEAANATLKKEAEDTEISHNRTIEKAKEKNTLNESEIDKLNQEIEKLKAEKKEIKAKLASLNAISDEDYFFLNGAKTDMALSQFCASDTYQDREYTVHELVAIGVPKEFIDASDSEGVFTSMYELRKTSDENKGFTFKIIEIQ